MFVASVCAEAQVWDDRLLSDPSRVIAFRWTLVQDFSIDLAVINDLHKYIYIHKYIYCLTVCELSIHSNVICAGSSVLKWFHAVGLCLGSVRRLCACVLLLL